jgi:prephenate dehydrogenase
MKIAILGGAGKMGQWLARFLTGAGEEAILIDRNEAGLCAARSQLNIDTSNKFEAVGGAKAIVISVPIDSFHAVVKELAQHIHTGQIVVDITSVKTMPVEIMRRYLTGCRILGTHPVFGPGASGINGHNVVLTPTSEDEILLATKVQAYLEARGARVSSMTPEKHDEMMAVVLGLAHYIAIVAGDTLLGFDNLKEMEKISGVTFKALLTLVESVLNEDPALYASIQMHLPPLPAIEADFKERAATWAEIVRAQDYQGFVQRMSALRQRLETLNLDTSQAYLNMYKLADIPPE